MTFSWVVTILRIFQWHFRTSNFFSFLYETFSQAWNFSKVQDEIEVQISKGCSMFYKCCCTFCSFFHFDNFIVDESLFILDIRKNDRLRRDFILMQVHDWLFGEWWLVTNQKSHWKVQLVLHSWFPACVPVKDCFNDWS